MTFSANSQRTHSLINSSAVCLTLPTQVIYAAHSTTTVTTEESSTPHACLMATPSTPIYQAALAIGSPHMSAAKMSVLNFITTTAPAQDMRSSLALGMCAAPELNTGWRTAYQKSSLDHMTNGSRAVLQSGVGSTARTLQPSCQLLQLSMKSLHTLGARPGNGG